MAYRVIIERPALEDIDAAYSWLLERTTHADPWLNGLYEAIESLSENPARCQLRRNAGILGRDVRYLLYKEHVIIFEIRVDSVNVVHVKRGKQLKVGEP